MRSSSAGFFAAPVTVAALAALAVLAVGLSSCDSDSSPAGEGTYCTEVGDHLADLNSPVIASTDDVEKVIAAWRAVADAAPLAIEAEWETVIASLETAATVDPTDPASLAEVAETARASEPAANRVIDYTFQLCNATIGGVAPVTTTPAGVPPTESTTGPPTSGS